jgi:hypothetical protein
MKNKSLIAMLSILTIFNTTSLADNPIVTHMYTADSKAKQADDYLFNIDWVQFKD